MGITSVREYWPDGVEDEYPPRKTYTRHFKGFFDDILDSPALLLDHPHFPQRGDPWEGPRSNYPPGADPLPPTDALQTDENATCRRRSVRRDPEGALIFYGECTYTDEPLDEDPLKRKPEVSWSSMKQQVAVLKDRHGRTITMSTKRLPDPPQEKNNNILVLRLTRFELFYDPAQANLYEDAINANELVLSRTEGDPPFTQSFAFAPGTARMHSIQSVDVWEKNATTAKLKRYDRVTYEIHFKRDGWRRQIQDQDYVERDPVTGEYSQIVDRFNTVGGQQHPLNGRGRELRRAATTLDASGGCNAFDTILTLTDANTNLDDYFPDNDWIARWGPYMISLDRDTDKEEIVKVVQVLNSLQVAVERAQMGTNAQAHGASATVDLEPVYLTYQVENELDFDIFNLKLD